MVTAARAENFGDWLVTLGVAAIVAWTTICLGGYVAETMVVTSRALWVVSAIAGVALIIWPRKMHVATLLPVPFLLYALWSTLWLAPAQWLAWREWLLWLQMWLVFVHVLHFCRSRAQVGLIAITMMLLGLVGVAMAAYQRFVDPAWMMLGRVQADQFVGRSAGMFGIPNSLAGLLELMIPMCAVLVGAKSVRITHRLLAAWLGVVWVFALVLTGSRGGWIGTIGALALWPLVTGKDWRRGVLGACAVIAGVVIGFFALYHFSEYARERIEPFLAGKFEASRPIIWKVGLRLWLDAPWLGTGAASYNVLFERYRPAGFLNEPDWTHNDYLNTLSDYGVTGFALWFGAGAAILIWGWRIVRQTRRERVVVGGLFSSWRWKFGLWLGLVAYALHLGVDFHTKIPALAFGGALVAALLLRSGDTNQVQVEVGASRAAGVGLILIALIVPLARADRLYRAEALRYESRRDIDRVAQGQRRLLDVLPDAMMRLQQASTVDPKNGQVWADGSYAAVLSWHLSGGSLATIGRRGEELAARAVALCPVSPEFLVRQGVALDMQSRRAESTPLFQEAIRLAPNRAEWRYYLGYHYSTMPERRAEALAALETCLTLDPSYTQAKTLRDRLLSSR